MLQSAVMTRPITATFSRWICAAILLAILVTSATVGTPLARADEQRWGFGSGLGFTAGTVNDTAFTLAFSGDYYLDRNFSVGPLMQISPMGDLFQVSFAGVGRYYFRFNHGINLVPFTGIGLIHADLDRGAGPGRIDRNDTSWYIPIGASLEYQASHNLALTSTLIVNLHDINLSPSLPENDTTSVALLFGFRYGP
ncbi:MAG: porin family protein [Nitrospira sp.]|nr:MAG: porin family protein [Nitrospira sp.]